MNADELYEIRLLREGEENLVHPPLSVRMAISKYKEMI
jgi:hypothetical protein